MLPTILTNLVDVLTNPSTTTWQFIAALMFALSILNLVLIVIATIADAREWHSFGILKHMLFGSIMMSTVPAIWIAAYIYLA